EPLFFETPLMKKILVIDDLPEQREYAIHTLKNEFDVTVATGYSDGKKKIEMGRWDIVLTDLSMPGEPDGLNEKAKMEYTGKSTPYGFILAALALRAGAGKVAIVSTGADDNHHAQPIFSAIDDVHGEIIERKFWCFCSCYCPKAYPKSEGFPNVSDQSNLYEIKAWDEVVKEMMK
ncbi:MAG: response regulator, partial [Patescibacteria group bacterium]|nr:response regulator [Patescibacteria group bacterium]